MKFSERLRIGLAAFKGTAGIELPASGRSSEETFGNMLSAYLSSFSTIQPVIDFEMLKALKQMWLYNPDFSQSIAHIVNMGNTGHQISIEAKSDATIAAAMARMDETSVRIYPNACGVDGLINQYLTSIAWSGAISSEDVVNIAARRIEKVVFVPVEQIRFKYNKDTDSYDPYQRATSLLNGNALNALGLNPLNATTYQYYALSTVENSPYAKPPATAAVEAILQGQVPIMENIRFMAQKVGLMGLVAVSVAPPPKKPGESEAEYQSRATAYIKSVKAALDGNLNKGLLVTARDQKVDHTPVTTGAAGVYDLNRMSEEQVFSATDDVPAFMGRTDSSTETFADVVYSFTTDKIANMQRPVKRRMERTYRLDFMLGGLDVDTVNLTFNKARSRNALQESQAVSTTQATVLEKVKSGLITPDEAAQELGYDNWFDPALIASGIPAQIVPPSLSRSFDTRETRKTITLAFNKDRQRYVYQPERIEIWSGSEGIGTAGTSVVPFIKKKATRA